MPAVDRLRMPLGEAIFTQRAIRRLKPDPVSDADLEIILAAGARAPSGGNRQPWRFLAVRDQKLKDQLAQWYVEAYWARRKERGFAGPEDIPKDDSSGQAALHYSANPENYSAAPILLFVIAEYRGADISAACQNLMLAARALGIGSTITSIGGIHEADVHRLLGIPDGMDATCCIPIGWPEGKFGSAQRKPLNEIAFLNQFGAPGPWTGDLGAIAAPIDDDRARLRDMITAFRVSDLVATAVELRLADYLASGPKTSIELAQLCGADPAMLHRVLRALTRIELVRQESDGHFALAPLGELLRSDVPDSMYRMARLWGTDLFKLTWMRLPHSVRTGQSAQEYLFGMRQFDYLSTQPEVAAIFNEGMLAGTLAVAAAAVEAYDFSHFQTIVDVGGGSGAFATTVLRANAQLRGIVFDLPYCEQGAVEHIASAGVSDRCEFVSGDFFQAIPPGADAYVLKFILHDWEDEKCVQLLRSCRAAAAEHAKLLLVESVLPPDGGRLTDAVFGDITMIVHTGGRERTEAEYASLLATAGFRLTRIVPTRVAQSVVEAVPG